MTVLSRDFYIRPDVVTIARELLGKVLVTNIDGQLTGGIITETEAYAGITDKASHAYGGRRTERTEIMYRVGGTAYVYLCYGVHSLFNIVTNIEDIPHAVLIRGIYPVDGIPEMLQRTGKSAVNKILANGPGKVSKALGIHYSHTGTDLVNGRGKASNEIWIEDRGIRVINSKILSSPRIGVEYAGEDALLPYRFLLSL